MPLMRAGRLRVITMLFFFGLAAVGLAFKTGTGTLCNLGFGAISAICPLGALETALAGRAFPSRTLISLGVVVVIIAVLGRFFCAWVCPAPFFRGWIPARIFPRISTAATQSDEISGTGNKKSTRDVGTSAEIIGNTARRAVNIDSRHYILGGALLSSALFGFPVFCLICPVGLILATFIGVWRLFQYNEPSWMLLVFPAIFILEIVICRQWCRKLCPLGALLSLLSGLNQLFRPNVNRSVCRHASQNMECALCTSVCEENIDLHNLEKSRSLAECTKCRECSDVCPAGAISFPLLPGKQPHGGA